MPDKRIVLLQSGGLDSCVCAALFSHCNYEVQHVFVDYGQNSVVQELEAAKKIVEKHGGKLYEVSIKIPWLSTSCKLVGHWDEGSPELEGQPLSVVKGGTYVPFRNALLLSVAASLAEAKKIPYIGAAFNGSENSAHKPMAGTVDAHPYFVQMYEGLLREGTVMSHVYRKPIKILTPVMDMYKQQIVQLGFEVNADMDESWSCYNNTEKPCGVCNPCGVRHEIFDEFGVRHGS